MIPPIVRVRPAALGVALAFAGGGPSAARAQLAVLTNLVEERTANPGDRYVGQIAVKNTSGKPQVARIYQTDFSFSADGTSRTDDPGTSPRSNAAWVHPQMTRVSIPAGAQIAIPYSVEVPSSDSLRGTYWSMIMIEGAEGPAAASARAPGVGIAAVMRYAVQVATHIGGTGKRDVRFTDVAASKNADGTAGLDLTVVDTGERGYRPVLSIELYDSTGTLRAKAREARGLLYPGTSLRQHYSLGALAAGTYRALLFADTGVEPVFATQLTVVF